MHRWTVLLLLAALCSFARPSFAADADADIRDVLATQTDAWNKGNLDAFMSAYADTCTFMGQEVLHSREKVRARYRKVYSTSAAMGKLTFTNLDVREVAEHFAIATGNWHLVRSAEGGGDTGGYFSLVLKDIDDDWKIILDHTTVQK